MSQELPVLGLRKEFRSHWFMHGILDRMLGVANPEPVC